ncbi:MAG TPA: hypothetical protein VHY55_04550 [Acidimicrobiia bacterium]|nr:hypothetical protein [Acidimicrobiia bacterium]
MSSTPSTPVGTTRSATIGRSLIVIGGALAAISSWLNWGAKTRELGPARTAYTIPAKFVIDSGVKVPGGGLNLGIVVLVLGLLLVVAAFAPWWKVSGLVVGVIVVVTGFLYVYQVRTIVHDHNLGKSVRDFISIGPYLVVVGGLLAVVGAVIALIPPGFWSSLTSEEEEDGERAGEAGPE